MRLNMGKTQRNVQQQHTPLEKNHERNVQHQQKKQIELDNTIMFTKRSTHFVKPEFCRQEVSCANSSKVHLSEITQEKKLVSKPFNFKNIFK